MPKVTQPSLDSTTHLAPEVNLIPAHLLSHLSLPYPRPRGSLPSSHVRKANTESADHRWEQPAHHPPPYLSKATLSGGTTGRGQAWPRITQAKGSHSELGPAAISPPTPNVPAPALRGPQMPPPAWPPAPSGRGMRIHPCRDI